MKRVIVPETPGAQSAMGLLMTDVKTDFMRTQRMLVRADTSTELAAVFDDLEEQAATWFDEQGIPAESRRILRRLDMRYQGQNFELPVEPRPGFDLVGNGLGEIIEAFHQAHERVYGYRSLEAMIEAITFRIEAHGRTSRVELHSSPQGGSDPSPARVGTRDSYLDTGRGFQVVPVYDRSLLVSGNTVSGPAIIEQMDTTTVLLPGDLLTVDTYRNMVIEIGDSK
jgi:N-methylhydantoinase A